ncbi:hypothetical protein [Natrononativus amylolyticus]|uniref:hypothetical protein n=1 Tax=Natrononativus amylolyticus TaxID=2963434 RepID=UPI0020CE2669|nr:hypothetical protein [Natrononativus amylolyticus]
MGVPGVAAADDDEYGTVLDIVDDFGADPTGEEPINDALAEATAAVEYDFSHYDGVGSPIVAVDEIDFNDDGVKVAFPEGEYVVDSGPNNWGFARWGISPDTPKEQQFLGKLAVVGDGDVTLGTTEGGRYPLFTLWGRDIRIENFTVDQTPDDTSTGITGQASERLEIRDIHFDGKVTGPYQELPHPNDEPEEYNENILDDPQCLGPGVFGSDGGGVIENVRAPDGVVDYSRKGGVWVTFHHAGDLLFRNCEFSYFGDNAIYASPPGMSGNGQQGSVRVEDSLFKNNNVTAIRLGTPGSYAKNCVVITEEGEIPATPWGAITSRAGWVWYTFDGYYENIDVIHDHPAGEGILDHNDDTRGLDLTVRNCRFELNNDGSNALRVTDPGVDRLAVRNVDVTGEAGDGAAVELGNTDVDVRNLCLSQTGDDRDGISLANATGSIVNANVDVTGEQIVGDDGGVTVRNLRDDGSCSPARPRNPLED